MRTFYFLNVICSVFNYYLGKYYYNLKLFDQSSIHIIQFAEYGYISARFSLSTSHALEEAEAFSSRLFIVSARKMKFN